MSRLSEKLADGTITPTNLIVAGFWIALGVIGIVIATVIGVPPLGYLGPVAALGYGLYDLTRVLRR